MRSILRCLCLFVVLCPWLSCQQLHAQVQGDSLMPEVVIRGLLHQPFTAGVKHQQLDSLCLQLRQGQSLASLLQELSPLYIREYGPGQLSTISFRGTSSSHTAVLWNGLNINSPTLGQTDFSQIPAFALENVQVQYGSSSSLYGSDALGGSIQLQTQPRQWRPGVQARLRQEAGSFGSYFTGLGGQWANRLWQTDLRAYRRSAENDFSYTNTKRRSRPREQNGHSAMWQEGIVAQAGFKPSNRSEWWLQGWWQKGWRQIQPMIGNSTGTDEQYDESLRLNLQYKQRQPLGEWQAQAGWLADEMLYNGASFKTRQFIAKSSWEHDLSRSLRLQAGGQWNWRQALNENYHDDENRLDATSRLRWQPLQSLVTSLNMRQVFTDKLWGPFSPTIGTELTPLRYLTLKALGGRHFRLPTLHDRFWPEVGQPNLKPEKGWHAETGMASQEVPLFGGSLQAEATRYWMWINDWIYWRPTTGSQWGPENLRNVYSRGWEGSLRWQHRFLQLGALGSYTRTENTNSISDFDRVVKQQLPFVPLWKGSSWLRVNTRGWLAELSGQYTGRRYTTGVEEISTSLPPFYLLGLSAGKTIPLQNHTLSVLVQLRNLLDHQYQNYENRAMPGRSFNLTINYIFTNTRE